MKKTPTKQYLSFLLVQFIIEQNVEDLRWRFNSTISTFENNESQSEDINPGN